MKLYIGNIGKNAIQFYYSASVEQGFKSIVIEPMKIHEFKDDFTKEQIDTIIAHQTTYGFENVTNRAKKPVKVNGSVVYSIDVPLYATELPNLGENK